MAEYTVIHVDDVPITSDNYQFTFFPTGVVAARSDVPDGNATFYPWHRIRQVNGHYYDVLRYVTTYSGT